MIASIPALTDGVREGCEEVDELELAVERFGGRQIEAAAFTWAGRMRRAEDDCPSLVRLWRCALADVVDDFVAEGGADGLRELAERVVANVETPPELRINPRDDVVGRWSRLVRALDVHSGAPSSFPLTVLAASDLAAIVDVAEERFGD